MYLEEKEVKLHGKIRRTNIDPNEIIMHEDYAEIILYDKNCNEKDSKCERIKKTRSIPGLFLILKKGEIKKWKYH